MDEAGERGVEGDGIFVHYASVRGVSQRFEDARVAGGVAYRYAVRPYDLAGNRGPMSTTVTVMVRDAETQPAADARPVDAAALDACTGDRRV